MFRLFHLVDMVIFLAFSLIFFGFIVLYFIGSRRFNRRSISGLERFRSYRDAVVIRLLEKLFRILGWIAIGTGLSILGIYVS